MADVKHLNVGAGDLILMVGTVKGAFLLRCPQAQAKNKWEIAGPYFPGEEVYSMAYDSRGGRWRMWAGMRNMQWAPEIVYSDDFGHTWTRSATPLVQFPQDAGLSVERIWQINTSSDAEDTVYAGTAPAGLFVSKNAGESFELVRGLHDHPHRAQWTPGNGGLCLHTILPEPGAPEKILVGVSTGGVYRTENGGETWQAVNHGIRADFLPDKQPQFGQCVHKIVRDAAYPRRFFLQNHGGIYRSDNGGTTWKEIAGGVPSDFGFAMAAHPQNVHTAYIIPLSADHRCVPDGKLRVYRTTDGNTWEALGAGLPRGEVWETVLRDAMCTDSFNPCGVYFGTSSGKIYASRDDGDTWELIRDGLPRICCVKPAVIG